jgi:pulcherriminic acid synthase
VNAKQQGGAQAQIIGLNGVPIIKREKGGTGYRTYEVHQRERVGESTEKIKPVQLISPDFIRDPYPLLAILRENYPCYRDWLGNAYWISRYNDVTSVFTDDANFETRPKLWFYDRVGYGRDLGGELPVLECRANNMDSQAEPVAIRIVEDFLSRGRANLATEFAARFAMELTIASLALPPEDAGRFTELYLTMQRGVHWDPVAEEAGRAAMDELVHYFTPLVDARRGGDGADLVSIIANMQFDVGHGSAEDVVVTLLEADHETLHGALANLWFLLLTHPAEYEKACSEPRMMKLAYLETLRHSTPVITAKRFARHEVERFGRLIPEGALMMCSAAAANRDARVFRDPDRFIVNRKDICHREARGQYRADGLATGMTPALGPPSKHPAVPEDRPRSLYALTRDTALTACRVLQERTRNLQLEAGAKPELRCLRLGEMHACWRLPVTFEVAD